MLVKLVNVVMAKKGFIMSFSLHCLCNTGFRNCLQQQCVY